MPKKNEVMPEHSPVKHEKGYWMTETCERCRRQSVGQKALLYYLLSDEKFDKFYSPKKERI